MPGLASCGSRIAPTVAARADHGITLKVGRKSAMEATVLRGRQVGASNRSSEVFPKMFPANPVFVVFRRVSKVFDCSESSVKRCSADTGDGRA